ncbi:hypothetical protein, partial [Klebsiella pneumoniae]|uniref:hypothetical protein n=1 Tax=Klebsiella pneumoniae TaxID=573 RepID=UPI00371A0B08
HDAAARAHAKKERDAHDHHRLKTRGAVARYHRGCATAKSAHPCSGRTPRGLRRRVAEASTASATHLE